MFGNTGKVIEVDLSAGTIGKKTLPEEYYKKYIGGSGLAAKLFWDRGNFDTEPLAPEAMLVFMNGPFAGLKMSGASRNSVAGRSPLTGAWGDSSCGGYFAPELRYAGYDGIVITGKAEAPSLLVIEDDNVSLVDAAPYWGKGIESVNDGLKEKYGKNCRTVVIGPAGEKQVKFANIMNEAHHAFGRAGFGAVMGAKNLKGIVVKATKKEMAIADPAAYEKLRKEVNPALKEALAAVVLNENGTAADARGGMVNGDVPIKNFASNYNEEMGSKLTGSELTDYYLTKRGSCAFCGIACKRVAEVKEGPWKTPEGPGPEYETIAAFGSLLNSADLAATVKVNRVCNDYGLDTISCGMTIAWAMEAFEKGHLTKADTDGIEIHWADMKTVIDTLVPAIALRGESRRAPGRGKRLGGKEDRQGFHRLYLPQQGNGGSHARSPGRRARACPDVCDQPPRGVSCRHPDAFYGDGRLLLPGDRFRVRAGADDRREQARVRRYVLGAGEYRKQRLLVPVCRPGDEIPPWVDLFNFVAGYNWDADEMLKVGWRVFYLKRLINPAFQV